MVMSGQTRTTLGSFELVSFPEFNIKDEVAKVDTGAYSGAIHCSDIHVVYRGQSRKKVLKFVPFGNNTLATETKTFRRKIVRNSSGHSHVRYLIQTTIEVQGKAYPVEIGLTDRSDMRRQVLIGRKFIRENNFLVDVRVNQEHDDEGDKQL
jgi:hypothetical protein